jgi:hypothetical protein
MTGKPRPLIDLLLSIVAPSIILMKYSGDQDLGASGALVVALAFPVTVGLYQLIRFKLTNYIALLGLISVLLTGSIGLLGLDTEWLAIKEAAVPAVLGFGVLISAWLRYPLMQKILFNPVILDTENISRILRNRGYDEIFETRLRGATYLLGVTLFFSSAMNYLLTKWIVTSPTGSEAFNEELGQLTLVSYPLIAIPSVVMMLAIFYFLWRSLNRFTGLKLEQVFVSSGSNDG